MKNIIVALIAMTTSVGCSISCDIQTRPSSDAGAVSPSDETSQIKKKPSFENAMTATEVIIYGSE